MNENKQRKRSCIFSAVLCFAMSAFFVFIAFISDSDGIGTLLLVLFLALLSAGLGVRSIYMIKGADRYNYHPDAPNSEYIRKKIAKAGEKHRQEQMNKKPLEEELSNPGLDIRLGGKKNTEAFLNELHSLSVPYDELVNDYVNGEIFRSFTSTLNIGDRFTIYMDVRNGRTVIRNRHIKAVYPHIENQDTYMNGIYTGTVQHFFVIVVTDDETYKLACREFMDRYVLEAYRKRFASLDPECDMYRYPEE